MTKSIKILTALVSILLMSSFTDKNAYVFIGTYGVSESNSSSIKLTINSDNTFLYQDYSISNKKVEIKGSWTQKGKKVILKDNNSGKKFHNVWSFTDHGQVAKSHRGLTFYRLCKMNG